MGFSPFGMREGDTPRQGRDALLEVIHGSMPDSRLGWPSPEKWDEVDQAVAFDTSSGS